MEILVELPEDDEDVEIEIDASIGLAAPGGSGVRAEIEKAVRPYLKGCGGHTIKPDQGLFELGTPSQSGWTTKILIIAKEGTV